MSYGEAMIEKFGAGDDLSNSDISLNKWFVQLTENLREQEAQLRSREAFVGSALELNSMLETESGDVVRFCLEKAVELTKSEIGFFHFVDMDMGQVRLHMWSHGTEKTCNMSNFHKNYSIDKAGVWLDCLHQKKPVVHNDYQSLKHKTGLPLGHVNVIREATIPVLDGNKIVAVMGVGNKRCDYTQFDVEQLTLMSKFAWVLYKQKTYEENLLVAHEELEKRVKQRTNELEEVNEQLKREINEHKTTDEFLRKSEKKYQQLFNEIESGFALHEIIKDERGKVVDFNFVEVNFAFEKLTGLKRDQVIGKTVKDVIPNIESYWIDQFGEVALTGKSKRVEQYFAPLGKYFEVIAYSPEKNKFASVFTDVTLRKHAEKAMQATVESTVGATGQQFFDNAAVNVSKWLNAEYSGVIKKLDDNRMLVLSMFAEGKKVPAFEYCVKDTCCEQVLLKGYYFVPGNAQQLFPKDEHLKTFSAQSYFGLAVNGANGDMAGIIVAISKKPMELPTGTHEIMSIIAAKAGAEIDRLKAERGMDEQRKALAHVSRVTTLGEMASGLAHELNQPLCAILSKADLCILLASKENLDKNKLREQLEDVCREAERAGDIIKHMRAFVKKRDSNRKKCDLRELVQKSVSLMQSTIRHKEIELIVKLSDKPVYVFADFVQLQQVIVNLIINAVEALACSKEKRLNVLCCEDQGKARVIVSDSGSGIKSQDFEKVFDFFYTTKRDGLGIGLSICKAIIEAHNGRIWATNNKDGSDFAFELLKYPKED